MRKQNEKLKELQERIFEAQDGAGFERELMRDIARHWNEQKAQGRKAQLVAAELGLSEWQLEAIDGLAMRPKRRRRRRRRGRSRGPTGLPLVVELAEQPLCIRVLGLPEELKQLILGGSVERDEKNSSEPEQNSSDDEPEGNLP